METLQRNANRGSVSLDYDIDNSYKNESDNTERMYRAWGAGGGDRRTWTISCWVKRTELHTLQYVWGAGTGGLDFMGFSFDADDTLRYRHYTGAEYCIKKTHRVFRDTSAWYHLVVAVDTTDGTAGDRQKIYINGIEETSFQTSTDFDQNRETPHNEDNGYFEVGCMIGSADRFNGYIAELYSITGSQLAPTAFGRFDDNGVWVPKDYTGSFSENSVRLEFKNSSSLGTDTSGNGQTFTLQNLSAIDQATDTPTNNFCTMNHNARTDGNIRTQEGGTYVTTDGGSGWCSMTATMAVGNGKWYWEALYFDNSDADDVHIGVAAANDPWIPHRAGGYYLGNVATGGSMGWDLDGGTNYNQNGTWGNPSRGDKLMVALDMDNYKLYYGINGTWGNSADPANGTGSVTSMDSYWMSGVGGALDFVMPAVSVYQGNFMKGFNFGGQCQWTIASGNADANGYGNFEYAPPSGFYALCSKNLAEFG